MNPMKQFAVHKILEMNLFGLDISLTNSAMFMIAALLSFTTLAFFAISTPNSYVYYSLEILYKFIDQISADNISKEHEKYTPFILAIFSYVLLGNLLGLIPYGFTFTSQIVVTFALAISVFILSILVGIMKNGIGFLKIFMPEGISPYLAPLVIPVEMISFLSRPFSLGIRLFANMVAGHAMMKVFASFAVSMGIVGGILPLAANIALTIFEFLVAFLQAYIFSVLTCMYVGSAIDLH